MIVGKEFSSNWGRNGRQLGRGSYGNVFALESEFVVKVIRIMRTSHEEVLYAHTQAAREISVLQELRGCEGVVQLHDYMTVAHKAYPELTRKAQLIFERHDGTLTALLASDKGVSGTQQKSIIYQLSTALAHCHQRGIVHRDLKPDNILYTLLPDDKVLIAVADFGLAKRIGQETLACEAKRTKVMEEHYISMMVYSMNYRPHEYLLKPEEKMQHMCDTLAADTWAFGCVCAEVVLKETLFQSRNEYEHAAMVDCMIAVNEPNMATMKKIHHKYNTLLQHVEKEMVTIATSTEAEKLKHQTITDLVSKLKELEAIGSLSELAKKCESIDGEVRKALKEMTKGYQELEVALGTLKRTVKGLNGYKDEAEESLEMIRDFDAVAYRIVRACLSMKPEKRPSMQDVQNELAREWQQEGDVAT